MILVVEDDRSIADFLATVLEKAGEAAMVESSSIDAVAVYLNDARITGVLCDFNLGGPLNGIEVLSAWQEVRPDVKRVLVTAHRIDTAMRDALQTGVIEVLLEKPPRLVDLRAAFSLSGSGLHRVHRAPR